MNLILLRTSSGDESSLGQLYIDKAAECFTLEDEYREVKIKGMTRIPDGVYQVELREEISPLTQKYRERFPWFTYHLHIKDVKGFKYVYIHCGNTDYDTDGCILLGDSLINNQTQVGKYTRGFLGNSAQAYARVYKKIHQAIKNLKEEVTIEIRTYKP